MTTEPHWNHPMRESRLAEALESLKSIRFFAQDMLENGHLFGGQTGSVMAIRDEADKASAALSAYREDRGGAEDDALLDKIGSRIADEVEKVAAGRQSNCDQAARDIIALWVAPPPSPTQEGGWQPIESAPKDGTVLDLWAVHTSCLGERTGQRYVNSKWQVCPQGYTSDGWRDSGGNKLEWRVDPTQVEEGCSPEEGRTVTHWMPLPPAPQPKEGR